MEQGNFRRAESDSALDGKAPAREDTEIATRGVLIGRVTSGGFRLDSDGRSQWAMLPPSL